MVARNIKIVGIINSKTFQAGDIIFMKAPSTTFIAGLQLNQISDESRLACHYVILQEFFLLKQNAL